MALDDHTAQAHLTPAERRGLLRAFADRMLRKLSAMDDPEDLPGVEKAMRVAAVIERVYSRCDHAERQIRDKTPDPHKIEAERATHEVAAIKARVSLANTLKWGEERRRDLGHWWDAAQNATKTVTQTVAEARPAEAIPPAIAPSAPRNMAEVPSIDYAARILQAHPEPGSGNPVFVKHKPAPA
ncbi:MAG: hypothetical protein QM647_14430 [Asticcacaulis sp.]|uniref:hypothetical protein n=1 Tax=Asticcacaulis sp. TaxID=1872648 RepID=UPI0039E28A47